MFGSSFHWHSIYDGCLIFYVHFTIRLSISPISMFGRVLSALIVDMHRFSSALLPSQCCMAIS